MNIGQIIEALKWYPPETELILSPPNSVYGYEVLSVQGITYMTDTLQKQGVLLNGTRQRVFIL